MRNLTLAGRCDSTGCRQRSETRSCGDACPTGVAHTFMAAEAIETEGKNVAGG